MAIRRPGFGEREGRGRLCHPEVHREATSVERAQIRYKDIPGGVLVTAHGKR